MKILSPHPPESRKWLILALAAILVAMGALYPLNAQADGGEFPTKTPTVTSTATATLTPTLGPTPTWTLPPSLTPVPLLGQEEQPPPVAAPLTTPSQGAGSSWLACWPFALFLFLAIVVGATYLLTRRARMEEA